jgi:alpha-galactosidase
MFKYKLALIIPAISILTGCPASKTLAASEPECYAALENNVLTIGNNHISRDFEWNKGDLKTISIIDKSRDDKLFMQDRRSDIGLGKDAGKVRSGQWTKKVVDSAITNPHLQVEVTATYEHLDVRRVFRIYPNCAVIGCDYYLRAHQGDIPEFKPQDTVLQLLRLPGAHWHYRAVEFFDRTDQINNLVRETSALAFVKGTDLRGNILYGQNAVSDTAILMVKEAPCSFTQLHYPGYDFNVSTRGAEAVGMGISPGDLPVGEWIRVYSLATGVCRKSETAFLKTLRSYQKQLRRYIPERDEMIMMNTWGDRNRDAKLGEEFVNKEVDACVRLGISHLQIDDGWQQGLSMNSAQSSGKLWDLWDEESWQPHAERFPRGLMPVVEHAKTQGIRLGLWFHPSNANNYANWQQDAKIVTDLYRKFGIYNIKIDGVKLPNKQSEINLRRFFDRLVRDSQGQIVVNLDATADNRTGYHYFYEYGNIYLENRYTDWGNYYPYWTLRSLWMLSKYVPAEKFQMEFLNTWRNANKYGKDDPLAPGRVPFGYAFAVTMMGQPLAFFEGTGLPEEAFEIAPVIKAYHKHQSRIHQGTILPIGSEPDGTSWSGFQSLLNEKEGYLLVFREYNKTDQGEIKLYDLAGRKIQCQHLCGQGKDFSTRVETDGRATFSLPTPHSFGLYRYQASE